jgi:hypothetical protein
VVNINQRNEKLEKIENQEKYIINNTRIEKNYFLTEK